MVIMYLNFKFYNIVIRYYYRKRATLFRSLNPEYNILKVARSLLGFKHSPESLELRSKLRKERGSSANPDSILKQVTALKKEKLFLR